MSKPTREDAADITIHNRLACAKDHRRDRAGSVPSYSREAPQGRDGPGNPAAKLGHDHFRRRVQVQGTAVVPESVPQGQHLLLTSSRQAPNGRKAMEELEVTIHNARDL